MKIIRPEANAIMSTNNPRFPWATFLWELAHMVLIVSVLLFLFTTSARAEPSKRTPTAAQVCSHLGAWAYNFNNQRLMGASIGLTSDQIDTYNFQDELAKVNITLAQERALLHAVLLRVYQDGNYSSEDEAVAVMDSCMIGAGGHASRN